MSELAVVSWAWIGTLYLAIMAYQDLYRDRLVDDRRNAFMNGMTLALIWWYRHSWSYIAFIILLSIGISLFFAVMKLGFADVHSFFWLITGFGLIGIGALKWFFICVMIVTVVWTLAVIITHYVKHRAFSWHTPHAYIPVLFASYVLTNIVLHQYA